MVGNEIGFNSSIFLARPPAFVGPSLCFYVSSAPDILASEALSGKTGFTYSRREGSALLCFILPKMVAETRGFG